MRSLGVCLCACRLFCLHSYTMGLVLVSLCPWCLPSSSHLPDCDWPAVGLAPLPWALTGLERSYFPSCWVCSLEDYRCNVLILSPVFVIPSGLSSWQRGTVIPEVVLVEEGS